MTKEARDFGEEPKAEILNSYDAKLPSKHLFFHSGIAPNFDQFFCSSCESSATSESPLLTPHPHSRLREHHSKVSRERSKSWELGNWEILTSGHAMADAHQFPSLWSLHRIKTATTLA